MNRANYDLAMWRLRACVVVLSATLLELIVRAYTGLSREGGICVRGADRGGR
jgi:hypothetical protein